MIKDEIVAQKKLEELRKPAIDALLRDRRDIETVLRSLGVLPPPHGNTGRAPANKRKRYGRLKNSYKQAPWNKSGGEQVFLCESVKKFLQESKASTISQ